jgi:hypothetical protein
VGRFLDRVVDSDGSVRPVKRSKIIGSTSVIDRDTASQILADTVSAVRKRPPESTMTVKQYTDQVWLPRVLPSVKNSTEEHYRYITERHITPCIGNIRLYELTDTVLQDFIDRKARERAQVKGSTRPLSWKTLKHIYTTIGSIMRLAVKQCSEVEPAIADAIATSSRIGCMRASVTARRRSTACERFRCCPLLDSFS